MSFNKHIIIGFLFVSFTLGKIQLFLAAESQNVISYTHLTQAGDTFFLWCVDGIDAGASGDNVIWDFSNIQVLSENHHVRILRHRRFSIAENGV